MFWLKDVTLLYCLLLSVHLATVVASSKSVEATQQYFLMWNFAKCLTSFSIRMVHPFEIIENVVNEL